MERYEIKNIRLAILKDQRECKVSKQERLIQSKMAELLGCSVVWIKRIESNEPNVSPSKEFIASFVELVINLGYAHLLPDSSGFLEETLHVPPPSSQNIDKVSIQKKIVQIEKQLGELKSLINFDSCNQ